MWWIFHIRGEGGAILPVNIGHLLSLLGIQSSKVRYDNRLLYRIKIHLGWVIGSDQIVSWNVEEKILDMILGSDLLKYPYSPTYFFTNLI